MTHLLCADSRPPGVDTFALQTAESLATPGFAAGLSHQQMPIDTFTVTLGTLLLSSTREEQERQRAPRGQGGQPLALRLNDLLGHTLCPTDHVVLVLRLPIDPQRPNFGAEHLEADFSVQTQGTFVQSVGAEIDLSYL